ncbi:hypothetical protein EYF80_034003 [Liparis tanakae]|uniref:Uncharacterized protein n=1 Tax=Liparis tanakae TaxID=230148 RepID=A0A4Z2GR97_9TELE|nr:hypothetical protein EYF80_034003 [Liparis tanakae]
MGNRKASMPTDVLSGTGHRRGGSVRTGVGRGVDGPRELEPAGMATGQWKPEVQQGKPKAGNLKPATVRGETKVEQGKLEPARGK